MSKDNTTAELTPEQASARIAELETENTQLQAEKAELETENTALKADVTAKDATIAEQTTMLEELNKEVAESDKKVTAKKITVSHKKVEYEVVAHSFYSPIDGKLIKAEELSKKENADVLAKLIEIESQILSPL